MGMILLDSNTIIYLSKEMIDKAVLITNDIRLKNITNLKLKIIRAENSL